MGTQLLPKKGAELQPRFSADVYCGQTAEWIKMALGVEVGLGLGHIVLDGDPAPLPKRGREHSPPFRPILLWPNGWMHQDSTWYRDRPQPSRLCVRWGPSPSPKKGRSPQFSAHVYCGRTAAWIKMPLGTVLGLGLRDIVFDVDPAVLFSVPQLSSIRGLATPWTYFLHLSLSSVILIDSSSPACTWHCSLHYFFLHRQFPCFLMV